MKRVIKRILMFLGAGIVFVLVCGAVLGGLYYAKIKMREARWRRFPAKSPMIAQQGEQAKALPEVFVASSLDRVFKDGMTLLPPAFSPDVDLAGARNEFECFQIIVRAGDSDLKNVELELADLQHEQLGVVIPKRALEWNVVGYVPTKKPYYPVKYVGLWPDPLLPPEPVSVQAGEFQAFWVSVYVPEDARPGVYRGHVVVKGEGLKTQRVPLSARVYDFALPLESRLKTAFDFYAHETYKRFPRKDDESETAYQARLERINDEIIIMMLRHRMNPVLNVMPNVDEEMADVDRYRVLGLNNFAIGRRSGTFGNNWPSTDEELEKLLPQYRTFGEILRLNRFLDLTYLYTWDEGDIGNPQVAKVCRMVHRAYPGLKNMVCYHGFWDPREYPGWGDDIDIWCFQIDQFNAEKLRRMQDLGKEMWTYISGPSGYGTPNLAIDFDSIDYRIAPWLCWKYDIKGLLYWCVNWWVFQDPFKNASNTRWGQNGNGLLFYPGEESALASLRIKVFRDGMDDYEYIQQLMDRLKTIRARKDEDPDIRQFWKESIALLTVDRTIARAMDDFTKNKGVLEDRRRKIARKIEEFDSRWGKRGDSSK